MQQVNVSANQKLFQNLSSSIQTLWNIKSHHCKNEKKRRKKVNKLYAWWIEGTKSTENFKTGRLQLKKLLWILFLWEFNWKLT